MVNHPMSSWLGMTTLILLWTLVIPMALTAQRQRGERSSSSSTSPSSSSSSSSSSSQSRGRHRDEGSVCELEINCKGDDVSFPMSVKLPIRGPRGPPGAAGERGEPGEDGLPGLPGLPGLSASVPKKVAFFVGLSENIGPVMENTDVIFDRIVTNIGGAYNEETGHFTAPVNATYQFNVVVSAQGRQKAAVMVVKNGEMVATVWAESIPYWASACNTVILSVDKGDSVWLMMLDRASYLHGYMYTTFSGFIVFEN